ncbi:MAG: hypothetical protein CL543_15750 [Alcanivorax sp.]|nr:hypothetical protein [Alcanivorax sp.]
MIYFTKYLVFLFHIFTHVTLFTIGVFIIFSLRRLVLLSSNIFTLYFYMAFKLSLTATDLISFDFFSFCY